MSALRCRVATFSSHKIYGPKGAGALCLRQGTEIAALFHGGHQEKNVRPGTENTAAIAGFGAAIRFIEAQREEDSARLARLKTLLYEGLRESCAPAELNGDPAACLPGTLNVRFPGLDAISFAMALDLAGVRVSTGAACTAGSTEPSHVLLALGLTEAEAKSSVRISMGHFTSEEDVRETIAAASRAAGRLRKAGTAL